jgi:DNA repair exonuclease SbcCD ATPase subunit
VSRLPSLAKAPLESAGDALKLREENRLLRDRCAQLQQRFTELMQQREGLLAAQSPAAAAAPVPVSVVADTAPADAAELDALRARLAAAEQAGAAAAAAAQEATQQATARAQRLGDELEAARKEATARVSDTKQFQSLQKMLQTKTQQVRELRDRLSKYVPACGSRRGWAWRC